jgi:hypothetical protein
MIKLPTGKQNWISNPTKETINFKNPHFFYKSRLFKLAKDNRISIASFFLKTQLL